MKEILDILEEYSRILSTGRKAALATVVRVEGSSYRQPGARMLISDEGNLTGAISGGCLEGDAMRKALLVIARGKPMLVTYDTTDDDDAKLGIGLGCSGIIHILIEPVNEENPDNPIQLLRTLVIKRQKSVLVTFFTLSEQPEMQFGTCFVYTEQDKQSGSLPEKIGIQEVISASKEALSRRTSIIKNEFNHYPEMSALMDVVNPVVHLVIAGAGNDIMPLVKMAGLLGWQITVLDGRPFYATCARFPDVHQVLVTDAGQALSKILIDENTVFVLMTHNYNYDLALLQQLMNHEVTYIGLLGPKKKFLRIMDELELNNRQEEFFRDHVYSPVGLDIGAETAEEIALSVMAEIKSALSGKTGKPLREKTQPIHQPLPGSITTDLKIQADFQP